MLLDAKTRGWPQPSLLDQTVDESVGHVRVEARRLVSALPDSEKELLLRLSLITGRFRREHALALDAEPPPLSRPGEAYRFLWGYLWGWNGGVQRGKIGHCGISRKHAGIRVGLRGEPHIAVPHQFQESGPISKNSEPRPALPCDPPSAPWR